MNSNRFFAELKRRNVYPAAALYGMSAWLIAPEDHRHAVVAVDCRFEIAQGELTQIETCSVVNHGRNTRLESAH